MRHHEMEFQHQNREQEILRSLQKCTRALQYTYSFITSRVPANEIPKDITAAVTEFSNINGLS